MENATAENVFHFEHSIGVAPLGRASHPMTDPIVCEREASALGR